MAAKNTYDVVLEKVGNHPLMTTKILCGTLGLGLAVAKGMVDKAPTTVAKGLEMVVSTGPGTICDEIKECRTAKPLMMQKYMHRKTDKL